jgi:hypothetical protein
VSGASGLGDYRWRGYSLAEKQQWMREGTGSGAVGRGLDFLGSLSSAYGESHQRLRGVLGELGVSWSGPAADAAEASLAQTSDRAGHLTVAISANGVGLGHYADSFDQLKVRIPAPIEVRAGWRAAGEPSGDLTVVGGLQSDLRAEQLAYQRADQEANAALEAHERSTRAVLDAWATPAVSAVSVTGGTGPVAVGADRSPPDTDTAPARATQRHGHPRPR